MCYYLLRLNGWGEVKMTAMIRSEEGVLCRDAWNPSFIQEVTDCGNIACKSLKEHYEQFKSGNHGMLEDIHVAMFSDKHEALRIMRELQEKNQLTKSARIFTVEFLV